MNLKKGLLRTITMGTILVGTVSMTSLSHAAIAEQGKKLKLKIPTYRLSSGYSYTAGGIGHVNSETQDMWKIYEYNDNGDTVPNYNNAIYCLKWGPGFGSSDGSNPREELTSYKKYADMKDPKTDADVEIINTYKGTLPETENYNAILWVLDHCYVPAPKGTVVPTEEQITSAAHYKKGLLKNAEIPTTSKLYEDSPVIDDLIDIIQQLSIWYFTNGDEYKKELTTIKLQKLDEKVKTLEEIYPDNWELSDELDKLYQYFITGGENATKQNSEEDDNDTKPMSLDASAAKVIANEDYYIVGPYKIEETLDKVYTLGGTLVAEDGTTLTYTLLDSDKKEVEEGVTLEDLVGENFYLKVSSKQNIDNAKFKVTLRAKQNTITYWEVAENSENEQPVAEIVPEEEKFEEEATIELSIFDLALRKFITNINGKELVKEDGKTYIREPMIYFTDLKEGNSTTAIYKHPKDPVGVSVGDIVIYTLRIYNEGEVDGYASSVTDYLPPQLQFVMDDEENFNAKYGWVVDSTLRKATTNYLAKPAIDPEDTLIKAFDGKTLDYQELKIKCRVVSTKNLDKVITNIAEITDFTDKEGNKVTDIDSKKQNVVLPSDEKLPDYKGNESNKSVLSDEDYFYKGQEDDDDFEKLKLEEFDLALRKFITKVNETPITDRVPVFTNVKDKNGNYIYEHTKEPIEVDSTDIVEYTLRIYNEGDIAGYAKQIKDNIPEGLEFLPTNKTNKEYRWIMLDKDGKETTDVSKAKYITTDYLSKEQEKTSGANLIEAFDSTKTVPDYKEVKVAFKVVALDTYEGIITNIAEISDDEDENGKSVEDKDSTPNNNNEKEDDIDKEHIKLTYFDLALRKFITVVNNTQITNRVPVFKIDEDGNYVYEHSKEPVEVENGNVITYTLRVYNEGTKEGYAKEIKDNLPEGLEFLPENETNIEYRWIMIDENGEETEDITKAVSIKTDYLSKEQEDATGRDNLLTKFDSETMDEPNYKEVKIAFKVTEPNTSDRILINKAQISDDSDKNGKDVIDKDSTPDKWIDEEDDQDTEKVKVKYFDLSLRKWVTQAIVIDNGKETITETGHKAEDEPEEIVKVEIKENRLNKVIVKFRYKIRVKNEGEIAGYATEISDYIPQGLKFVAADNPTWKEVDGKVVTDQLKDTLLQPGETAEVEILLTWINAKDNFNLKVNTAEISKDKNDSNTPDIDSTPNNEVKGEDDIDDAPVILTIKTGAKENRQYMTLGIGALGILASGVILIKKYVL